MTNRFQGDPKIIIKPSGASLQFTGGQPLMDAGVENLAIIGLFTAPGWWGNSVVADPDKQIGSDFEETAMGAITLSKLNDIRQSAEKALANPAFGTISVEVTNPSSTRIDVVSTISPPGRDVEELRLSRFGANWQAQAVDPAHKGVN